MTITAFNLTSGADAADATSYTTASITPTANRLVLAFTMVNDTGANPSQPTLSGNGLTWIFAADRVWDSSRRRITVFRAMTASPSAGIVTIDCGATTHEGCGWSINEFAGIDTGGTHGSAAVIQSLSNFDDGVPETLEVTLGAFGDAANATFGAFAIDGISHSVVQGAGFTELSDDELTGGVGTIYTEWRNDNDISVDISWTTGDDCAGMAVEIGAAPVPQTGKVRVLFT